jgi:phosphatidylinositol kinase/protein kinase (PI-3  family)
MGGLNSDMFKQFKELLILGFTYIRKYANDIVKYVEVIRDKNDLPCFQYYDKAQFETRLMIKSTDKEVIIPNNLDSRQSLRISVLCGQILYNCSL